MKCKKKFSTYKEILDEFNIILQLETKISQTYEQLAQDCDHPQAKKLLQYIAKKESQHNHIAQELIQIIENSIKDSFTTKEEK